MTRHAQEPAPFAYDAVAYPSLTHPQSHPAALAPKACLFGLSPALPSIACLRLKARLVFLPVKK